MEHETLTGGTILNMDNYKSRMEILSKDRGLAKAWMQIKKIKVADLREILERYRLNKMGDKSILQERVFRFRARIIRPHADIPWSTMLDEITDVAPNVQEAWIDTHPPTQQLSRERVQSARSDLSDHWSDQGAVGGRGNTDTESRRSSVNLNDHETTARLNTDTSIVNTLGPRMSVDLPGQSTVAEIVPICTTSGATTTTTTLSYSTVSRPQNTLAGSGYMSDGHRYSLGARRKSLPLGTAAYALAATEAPGAQTAHSSPMNEAHAPRAQKRTLVAVEPIEETRLDMCSPVMHTLLKSDSDSESESEREVERQRRKMERRAVRERNERNTEARAVRGSDGMDVRYDRSEIYPELRILMESMAALNDRITRTEHLASLQTKKQDSVSNCSTKSKTVLNKDCRLSDTDETDSSDDEETADPETAKRIAKMLNNINKWDLKFAGLATDDPETFLNNLRDFRATVEASWPELRRCMTSMFKGVANKWYKAQKPNFSSWQTFKKAFRNMYDRTIDREELLDEIRGRTQGMYESTAHYVASCCMIIGKIKDPPPLKEQLRIVLNRLQPRLRDYIEDKEIVSWEAIQKWGKKYEDLQARKARFREPCSREYMLVKDAGVVSDIKRVYEGERMVEEEVVSKKEESDKTMKVEKVDKNKEVEKKNTEKKEVAAVREEGKRNENNQAKQNNGGGKKGNGKGKEQEKKDTQEKKPAEPTTPALDTTLLAQIAAIIDAKLPQLPSAYGNFGNDQGGRFNPGGRGRGQRDGPPYYNARPGQQQAFTPNTQAVQAPRVPFYGECFYCREIGHRANECVNVTCFACNAKGHVASKCPSRQSVNGVKCDVCGTPNVTFSNCPNCSAVRLALGNAKAGCQAGPLNPARQ